jgi:P-type Cu+ transporter
MMNKKTDPVCKMEIDESVAAGKSEHLGETYYFCSARCKNKFDEKPSEYRTNV